ncbi:hypothetical protein DICPUDRAFT_82783 [Dictyostelium purpureum]|uniref:Selenoprotein F n=1 Tax=Dictyostelium purpureum TaxID=5786 RepID=F0ZXL1_DICPU|nr:uncharacterized protein DICPUDRAFT_82783 [Dictyostelium purpureum]EGC31315.1 hypothetical protein DICPUDRAFT_82783 [Dictyostelium purpureum]|eukprot:XP_003292159.1 hypothetical protein DICPUDRAFT_82783 [Dictyostelium purpureum]
MDIYKGESSSISITSPKHSCHELGFTDSLLCSTCKDFAEFVGDSDFIDNKAKDYNKFKFTHEQGANPRLVLRDTEGKEEEISIDGWKSENLEEFLIQNNLKE